MIKKRDEERADRQRKSRKEEKLTERYINSEVF